MEYRLGALHVVQDTHDKWWIDRLLHQIDERLFAEKQLTFADEQVWCVVEDTGEQNGESRFVVVHEFRDGHGKPIPYLTEAIVDEMRRRAQDGTGNIREASRIAQRRNQERVDARRRATQEAAEDINRDFEQHRVMGNFSIPHRSPGLARARARAETTRVEQLRAVAEARRIAVALARRGARDTLVA